MTINTSETAALPAIWSGPLGRTCSTISDSTTATIVTNRSPKNHARQYRNGLAMTATMAQTGSRKAVRNIVLKAAHTAWISFTALTGLGGRRLGGRIAQEVS